MFTLWPLPCERGQRAPPFRSMQNQDTQVGSSSELPSSEEESAPSAACIRQEEACRETSARCGQASVWPRRKEEMELRAPVWWGVPSSHPSFGFYVFFLSFFPDPSPASVFLFLSVR